MNETNFNAEFVLPKHLQEQLDGISAQTAKFVIGVFEILYPNFDDMPENVIEEVVGLLVPKIVESMNNAIANAIEELG